MHKEIIRANKKLESARLRRAEVITRVQSECPHERVVEGKSYLGTFITQPPFAIYEDCGYAEEGWGSGYKKLRGKIKYSVDRDEARKFIVNGIVMQERSYDD